MDNKLPSRPNLQHLKGQAKQLLVELRGGSLEAANLMIDYLPAAGGMSPEEVREAGFRLADAQSAIARKNGFASWPGLSRYVELLRALEGTWEFQSLEVEGNAVPTAGFAGSRILVDGDRFRTESPMANYDGEFTIDADVKPHTLDIEFVQGPEAGNWSYGIFELQGDTWTICLGLTGAPRPTEFVTTPGSGHALEVLKRSDPSRPVGVTGGERLSSDVEFEWVPGPITSHHDRLQGTWKAVQIVSGGQPLPPDFLKGATRTSVGRNVEVKVMGQKMLEAETNIDDAHNPIHVDYLCRAPGDRLSHQLGIMEWIGDGEVRFCFALPGEPRPIEFSSPPGSGTTLSVWRR
ncbi:MAG: TIGR03067 domain-containing protein [Armatimonadetes bacterium]|nr:TIGR03067 domain-containing protein [Armatimonadota bacterium]